MLAEISAGLSSLKAAKDIVQGLNALKTEAAINGVKIELQGLILDAQQGLFAAQERKRWQPSAYKNLNMRSCASKTGLESASATNWPILEWERWPID